MSKSWEISKPKPKSNIGKFMILTLVIVLAVAGVIIFTIVRKPAKKITSVNGTGQKTSYVKDAVCATPANNDLLTKLVQQPSSQVQDDLLNSVNTIKSSKNYQQDPNCLYILVNYYLNVSDTENASKYLTQLAKVYDPSTGYDSNLTNIIRLKDLQNSLAVIKKSAESSKKIQPFGQPQ